jgi:hypothetical protein
VSDAFSAEGTGLRQLFRTVAERSFNASVPFFRPGLTPQAFCDHAGQVLKNQAKVELERNGYYSGLLKFVKLSREPTYARFVVDYSFGPFGSAQYDYQVILSERFLIALSDGIPLEVSFHTRTDVASRNQGAAALVLPWEEV